MVKKTNQLAYAIFAGILIVVVIFLTCMMMNDKKTKNVKWPWIPDDFNGPMYLAPPGFLSGSDEEPPNVVRTKPMRLLKNQYQCPDSYMGCWSGCDYPISKMHSRECPYYHSKKAGNPEKWGAYMTNGTPYSPQGYPGYTYEETRIANSRLGPPRVFSPINSCKVGYNYGIYNNNGCLPFMTTDKGIESIIDY